MTIKAGDTLFNGQIIVVTVNEANLVTRIQVPLLGDGLMPLTIDFAPGQTPAFIESLIGPLLP